MHSPCGVALSRVKEADVRDPPFIQLLLDRFPHFTPGRFAGPLPPAPPAGSTLADNLLMLFQGLFHQVTIAEEGRDRALAPEVGRLSLSHRRFSPSCA